MNRRRLPILIKRTARKLRKEQTDPEAVLWAELRNKKLADNKFLRQHPVVFKYNNKKRFIIADFYCHRARLIIELDGGIHEKQKDYDETRDQAMKVLGLKVLRIKNEHIEANLLKVKEMIERQICST